MTNMIIKYCTTILVVQRRIGKILSVSEFYIYIYIQKNNIYIGGYLFDLFYRNGTTQYFSKKKKEIIP